MEQTMARTNYNQVKRNKEAARKARQDARLARRQSRTGADAPPADDGAGTPDPAAAAAGPKP
jgi:hypothetical protein